MKELGLIMQPTAQRDSLAGRLRSLVRDELAPTPGRKEAVCRFVVTIALVMTCSLALRVPMLALSVLMVFFTAQGDTVLTKFAGLVIVIGSTGIIALALLLLKLTMGYPVLRLLGSCAIAFIGVYFMRISKFGIIGFGAAMAAVYVQSLVDLHNNPEALTRFVLWVWVAITYPTVLTVIVNMLMFPARPEKLLIAEMCRQLDDVMEQLDTCRTHSERSPLSPDAVARGLLTQHRLLASATQSDETYRHNRARHLTRIAAIDHLRVAAVRLSRLTATSLSSAQLALVIELRGLCRKLQTSIAEGLPFHIAGKPLAVNWEGDEIDKVLCEMAHAIENAVDAEPPSAYDQPFSGRDGLFAPDAFTNPAYWKFALRTVLTTMACYVFYTGVQWPGIHTVMLTCIIVAMPSVGAATHRGIARIVGCALGSLVALICTVFIIPHLESIVGFLLLTLPIVAAGAWIASGSPRTSYVGVQFVFAYALAQLGQFAPTTDLTEIRDRMIGILIGVAVSVTVSTLVWPEREGEALRAKLGKLLRSIADLARAGNAAAEEAERRGQIDAARLKCLSLLAANREMEARVALEPSSRQANGWSDGDIAAWLAQTEEMLFSINWFRIELQHSTPRLSDSMTNAFLEFRNGVAAQLEWTASRFDRTPTNDPGDSLTKALAELDLCRQEADPSQVAWLNKMLFAAKGLSERIICLDRTTDGVDA